MAEGLNIEEEISAVTELLALWQELGEFTRPLWEDGDYVAFKYRGVVIDPEHEARYRSLRDRITRLYAGLAGTVRTYGGTVDRIDGARGVLIRDYDPLTNLFQDCPDLRSLSTSPICPGDFKSSWNAGYQILNTCLGRLEAERRNARRERPASPPVSSARPAGAKASRARGAYHRVASCLNWTERNVVVRALIIVGGVGAGILVLWTPGKAIWGRLRHVEVRQQARAPMSRSGTTPSGPETAPAPPTAISPTVARPGIDRVVPAEGRTHQPQPPPEPGTVPRDEVKSPVPSQALLLGPGAKVVQDSRNAIDSPNIIAGGDVTINPPANPNEWTVRYEFNGHKHKQRVGEITMENGEALVFQKIKSLYDAKNWKSLLEVCEAETKAVPEWLTPYLYAGVGYGNLGERERAIQYLEYVEKRAAGDPMYADATRLLKQLRERQ